MCKYWHKETAQSRRGETVNFGHGSENYQFDKMSIKRVLGVVGLLVVLAALLFYLFPQSSTSVVDGGCIVAVQDPHSCVCVASTGHPVPAGASSLTALFTSPFTSSVI